MSSCGNGAGRRPRFLAGLAAIVVATLLVGESVARTDSAAGQGPLPSSSMARLAARTGQERVVILLRAQPLLRAAALSHLQRLQSRPLSHPNPGMALGGAPISPVEIREARQVESERTQILRRLAPVAGRTLRQQRPLIKAIIASGGRVIEREPLPSRVIASLPAVATERLKKRPDVHTVKPALLLRPSLDLATQSVGANTWWAANHTGGTGSADSVPADLALQAEGVDPSHPAFAGVNVDNSPFVTPDDHGTHTGGIVASQDATYKGLAFGVDRLIGSNFDAYALGIDAGEGAAADPAEVISSSFTGTPSDDDTDNPLDVEIDKFAIGYAQSAGNNGPANGSVGAIGRNLLSVGALDEQNTVAIDDDTVASFSGRGPTPGGRKKPDLAAPGVAIAAPSGNWNAASGCGPAGTDSDGTCKDFTSASGTSYAAPMIAGSMTLLAGVGIADPKAERAILINSARPVAGQSGWRPDSGWGALDLTTAFAQRGYVATGAVPDGSVRFYQAIVAPGAKATLIWNRRGVWGSFPSCCSLAYTTTNLDLHQLRASDGSEVMPSGDPGHGAGPDALDSNDTVEQVRAPAEETQAIIYKVKAASSVVGAQSEPFALATAAPLSALENPSVEPTAIQQSPSASVCSDLFVISTALQNPSPYFDALAAHVTLSVPSAVQIVSGPATQEVSDGTLEKEATSERHSWTVRLLSSGTKTLTVNGWGTALGESFNTQEQISLSCTRDPAQLTLRPAHLAQGRLVTSGRLANVDNGVVTVRFRWQRGSDHSGKRRLSRTVPLASSGHFAAAALICRSGSWRASVRFAGNDLVAPKTVYRPEEIDVNPEQLRC